MVGRVAELADAKDLGSFGEILAGSTPVAPTNKNTETAGLRMSSAVSGGTKTPRLTLAGQGRYYIRKVNAARREWL